MCLSSLLSNSFLFEKFQRYFSGEGEKTYAERHVKAAPGDSILDIGCGPATILDYLPEGIRYVGFDMSQQYIDSAKKTYSGRGEFHCARIDNHPEFQDRHFDIVMANGVLHHLNEDEATRLFEVAYSKLRPGGRLVTLDGCYLKGQGSFIKFLLDIDRGKFVRDEGGYVGLAARSFADKIETTMLDDLYRVPYTVLIMECTRPE